MKTLKSTEGNYCEGWFFFHHKTDKAILISETGRKEDAVWVPLSQCQNEPEPEMTEHSMEVEICIPEWLAVEKGLA